MRIKDLSNRNQYVVAMSYDGAHFFGVQEQRGLITVMGEIRRRLEKAANQKVKALFCAARTDRGVSAECNIATFYFSESIDDSDLLTNIVESNDNRLAIGWLKRVSAHVHARGNAREKYYRYTITDGCDNEQGQGWVIHPVLDAEKMALAARSLVGEHDFKSFRGGGCQASNTTKTIFSIEVKRNRPGQVLIDIVGNAFLRKMVRNIVGLLVEIGSGLRPVEDVAHVIQAGHRDAAGICAPPQGLCLIKVAFNAENAINFPCNYALINNIKI